MSDYLTMHSVAHGGHEKSSLRKWYEKLTGGTALARTKTHVAHGMHAMRAGSESLVVGGLLGAADAYLKTGLDVHVYTGKDGRQYNAPVDGAVAAIGLLAGTAMAHEEFGKDLLNAGAAAAAICSFRKSRDFISAKMRTEGKTPGYQQTIPFAKSIGVGTTPGGMHGETQSDDDPIIAAARLL